jgi:hypothetical protein
LNTANKLLDRFEPIVQEYPGNIEYAHQFIWWFYFTQHWQVLNYRLLSTVDSFNEPKIYFPSVTHFYDTNDFQLWAIFNQDKKITKDMKSHKWPAKQYIVDFTNDLSFHNKIKQYSLQNVFKFNRFHWGVDTDYNFLTLEQLKEFSR